MTFDPLAHSTRVRAPASAAPLADKLDAASVASAICSHYSVTAKLRAIGFRHVSSRPANLGQHFAALIARLVGACAILDENSGLLLSSQSHDREGIFPPFFKSAL
jgi:hypothetical protein